MNGLFQMLMKSELNFFCQSFCDNFKIKDYCRIEATAKISLGFLVSIFNILNFTKLTLSLSIK